MKLIHMLAGCVGAGIITGTLVLLIVVSLVGCASAPEEPEPSAKAGPRSSDLDRLINACETMIIPVYQCTTPSGARVFTRNKPCGYLERKVCAG